MTTTHTDSSDTILTPRQKRILRFVVEHFVGSGVPVGSRALSKLKDEHLSPASIRNTMADLEDMGYLSQPHTSAGRVPTDPGYRYYIDQLMPSEPLPVDEVRQIRDFFDNVGGMVDSIFQSTSRLLSRHSHYIGIVSTPRFESLVFEHIHFVRKGPGRILVIFVARNGTVHNKLITFDGDFNQDLLDKAGRWLVEHFRGLSLAQVKERIEGMLSQERARYDLLMRHALLISRKGFEEGFEDEALFIDGTTNIVRDPDFAPHEKLEEILEAIEHKSLLVRLLGQCLERDGVQVVVGSEGDLREISGCSLVAAAYNFPDGSRGVSAVLGPTRMHYPRNMYLVDFISRQISKIDA
jgi:heat-inducible transcriptional repressor